MRKNHVWAEEEQQIVRRDYSNTKESCREIAERLSKPGDIVTPLGVKQQVSIMGLAKRSDYARPWTPKEDEKLIELIGKHCPRRVARMMHRSINSVVVRSKRLRCSRRARNGWYCKREVCEILGMDHKWVQRRIDSGALKATYHYDHRPSQLGGSSWHIEEKDLRDFIRRYPQELNGRNMDIIAVVDILVGVVNNQH